MWNYVKQKWHVVIAILAVVPSALSAFQNLMEMPLFMRLLIVCTFNLIVITFAVIALTSGPAGIGGFANEPSKTRKFGFASASKIVGILLLCASSAYLLKYTITYHNLTLDQTTDQTDSTAGLIELWPSHLPADVTLVFSTPQPDVRILDLRPEGCGQDPINTPNIQDPNDFSEIIHLDRFKVSQKLCVPYRLSDRASRLGVAVSTKIQAPYMEILNYQQVSTYDQEVYGLGGVLCLFALVLFFWRSY